MHTYTKIRARAPDLAACTCSRDFPDILVPKGAWTLSDRKRTGEWGSLGLEGWVSVAVNAESGGPTFPPY